MMGNGRRPYKRIVAKASAAVSAVAMLVTLTVAGTAWAVSDTSMSAVSSTVNADGGGVFA